MCSRERYEVFCAGRTVPVFFEPWWLDAVCDGKTWLPLINADGTTIMPLLLRHRPLLGRYTLMPQHTPCLGIFGGDFTADLFDDIERLQLSHYVQNFRASFQQHERLLSHGFIETFRTNYVLPRRHSLDDYIGHFDANKRRMYRKSLRTNMSVESSLSVDECYAFHQRCVKQAFYSLSHLRRLVTACEEHHQGQCFGAYLDDLLIAILFVVWDTQRMYYLIPAIDPLYRDTGASLLLLTYALQRSIELGVTFDLDGSMKPSIAHFYETLGATKELYPSYTKTTNWLFKPVLKVYQHFHRI